MMSKPCYMAEAPGKLPDFAVFLLIDRQNSMQQHKYCEGRGIGSMSVPGSERVANVSVRDSHVWQSRRGCMAWDATRHRQRTPGAHPPPKKTKKKRGSW